MELPEWINSKGGDEAVAKLLGEKERTVKSWRHLERAPSLKSACNIVKISGRVVDFNGIFAPLCRKLHGLECGK